MNCSTTALGTSETSGSAVSALVLGVIADLASRGSGLATNAPELVCRRPDVLCQT